MAGSNDKVFTAVLDDKPASLANGNHRAIGLFALIRIYERKLLRCRSYFRLEPFTGSLPCFVCARWSRCCFSVDEGPRKLVCENQRMYFRVFGSRRLEMTVMNMDSNIKDNMEPVPQPPLWRPSSPTGHRGGNLISDALLFRSLAVW